MTNTKAITYIVLLIALSQPAFAWTLGKIGSKSSGYWTKWQLGVVSNTAGLVTCEYHRYWIDGKTGKQEKEQTTTTNAVFNTLTRSYHCQAPKNS